jgi:hypothetical protein
LALNYVCIAELASPGDQPVCRVHHSGIIGQKTGADLTVHHGRRKAAGTPPAGLS